MLWGLYRYLIFLFSSYFNCCCKKTTAVCCRYLWSGDPFDPLKALIPYFWSSNLKCINRLTNFFFELLPFNAFIYLVLSVSAAPAACHFSSSSNRCWKQAPTCSSGSWVWCSRRVGLPQTSLTVASRWAGFIWDCREAPLLLEPLIADWFFFWVPTNCSCFIYVKRKRHEHTRIMV